MPKFKNIFSSGSDSESSNEKSQNDERLVNTEWLVTCVC